MIAVRPFTGKARVKIWAKAKNGKMVTTCVPINAYRDTLEPMSSQLPTVVI